MLGVALKDTINWFSLPILALLAGILVWRKTTREFPYFFCYVVVGESVDVTRLWAYYHWYRGYLFVFWTTDVLIAIFTFLVAYELFVRRLFPRFYAVRFYRYLFPLAGFCIALIAAPSALVNSKVSLLLTLIHGLEILRVTVLLFFVGLMILMGRHWGRYEFGIALGLGIQASAMLVTSANWTRSLMSPHLTDRLPVVAYDVACLAWLLTFLRSERMSTIPANAIKPEVLQEAKRWEDTLKKSLTGKKPPQ
jgi:hypothetical protein